MLGEDKTVIRGGYRLSYDPPYYNIYLNMATYAPQALSTLAVSPGPMSADPTGPTVRSDLAAFLPLGVLDPRSVNQTSIAPDFGPDHVHSWSFGIQRELGSHAAVEARYVGNKAGDLFQSINANPNVAGLAAGIADGVFSSSVLPAGVTPCSASDALFAGAVGRVHCDEARVRERTNTAYSNYNAFQGEFRTNNLFDQLTLKTNYTWSKTLSNADEIFGSFSGGGTYAFSQNPLDYKNQENGISGLDFPIAGACRSTNSFRSTARSMELLATSSGGWNVAGSYILAIRPVLHSGLSSSSTWPAAAITLPTPPSTRRLTEATKLCAHSWATPPRQQQQSESTPGMPAITSATLSAVLRLLRRWLISLT